MVSKADSEASADSSDPARFDLQNATTPKNGEPSPLTNKDDHQARRRIENQLRVTFFITLFVGLTGGAFDNWVIPTISVCAYAVIGWTITRHEENIERFADSLYYMGFLFTIWGLLFAFGPWKGNVENLSSKSIITQFGIKLITTVIALTARIILIQARTSLAEATEETRETLGALAKAMSREIEQNITEFRKSRDRLLADAAKGVSETQLEAMRQLGSAHSDMQSQMHTLLSDVHRSSAALLAQIAAIEVPSDVLAAPLTAAARRLAAETEQLQTKIHEASAGIAEGLTEGFKRVEQLTKHLDAAVKGLKGFEAFAGATDSAAKSMAAANAALETTLDQTNRLLRDLTNSVAELQDATGQDLKKIRSTIDSTAKDISALGSTIRQDAKAYSVALTESIRRLRGEIDRG